MNNIPYGLVYDLLFLAVLVWAAVQGHRRGFVAGVFGLAGTAVGIVGAVYATREWASRLYAEYVGSAVADTVAKALAEAGGDLNAALQTLDFLPESVRETVSGLLYTSTDAVPAQVVNALEPLMMPLIQVLVFMVVCALIRLVFRLLTGLLKGVNHIPLLGGMNQILGVAFGFVTGVLNCWLLSLGLWMAAMLTQGKLEFLTLGLLRQSNVYDFFQTFNPFLTYY